MLKAPESLIKLLHERYDEHLDSYAETKLRKLIAEDFARKIIGEDQ